MINNDFGPWVKLHAFLVRHRLAMLIVAVVMTGVFFSQFPTIQGDENGPTGFLPQDIEEVAFWQDLNNRFGALNNLMIGLEEPGDALTSEGLTRVANITRALEDMKKDGLVSVRSVINVESTEVDEEGTVHIDNTVPSIPMNQEGLDALAGKILSNVQVPGAFVSKDLKAYVVMVKLAEKADSAKLAEKIINVVERERGSLSSYYFGSAFATYQVSRRIIDGLRWVIPVFAAGLFLVLFMGLRRPSAILMTLLCAVMPLVWWLGTLHLLGVPVTMPVLNGTLLLLTFGALVYSRAAEGRTRGTDTFFGFQSFLSLVATAGAFVVLTAWLNRVDLSIPFLEGFGPALSIGFAVLAVASIVMVIPLMTILNPAPESAHPVAPRTPASFMRRMAAMLVPIAVFAISMASVGNFRFAVSLKDMFSTREDVGRGVDFFDRKIGGNEIMQVSVKGDFTTAAALNRLMRFADLVEGSGEFADVRCITQIVAYLADGMTGTYWIPPEDDQLNDIFFYLEGIEDVKALVSADRDEAMLAIRMPAESRGRYDDLIQTVRRAADDSARTGTESGILRLAAIARIYGVTLPDGRIDQTVAEATRPVSEDEKTAITASIREWLDSEDSPWNPAPEEWDAIAPAIHGGAEGIAAAVGAQPSWVGEGNSPEMAMRVAESIMVRIENMTIENRAKALVDSLSAGVEVPGNFRMRALGVLASVIAPTPEGSQELEFAISGYPAFTKPSEQRLMGGLQMAALLLFLSASVYVMFLGFGRPSRLLVLPVGAAATAATFAVSGALGLNADPNSASIYLLAPLAWLFLSEMMNDESGHTTRNPTFFALALAAGGASLLMFGVMPIIRIGGALTLSLVITVVLFAAVRRLYYAQVKA